MSDDIRQPFDSIESTQEFMVLLSATVEETVRELECDRERASSDNQERHVRALDLALYKLKVLDSHIHKSRRILNDLRVIRRLLLDERASVAVRTR